MLDEVEVKHNDKSLLSKVQAKQSQRSCLVDIPPQVVRLQKSRFCRAPVILMSSLPIHPTFA